ncbi:Putative hydrolase of the HAD superfamily [Candidatus Hydrogenisulfobacillus filiaventi]|uniref:Hydrolase of the HAD superfamily n=1 Tax=Candidatus Hydrogenisulfobacillus filiaventi TaxID=2707344 RepID=A0A6F8ZID4_9FIRM|nr:Putative hydrolase of the HAD superfamily [Candidatus Hydrogenisulfobacillus filiaventi]
MSQQQPGTVLGRVRAVFFDLDDTLYDFRRTWETVTRAFLAEILPPPHRVDEVWPAFDRLNRVIYHYADRGHFPGRLARRLRWELLAAFLGLHFPDFDALTADHIGRMAAGCVPFPDTLPTLARLRALGLTLGVITNGPRELLARRLTAIGARDYFPDHLCIAADQVGRLKPGPEIFLAALAAAEVAPHEALYVGDSWTFDVKGAEAAGIPVIWIDRRRRPPPDPALIVAAVPDLTAVADLLTRARRSP